jgi:hypothetical protein
MELPVSTLDLVSRQGLWGSVFHSRDKWSKALPSEINQGSLFDPASHCLG